MNISSLTVAPFVQTLGATTSGASFVSVVSNTSSLNQATRDTLNSRHFAPSFVGANSASDRKKVGSGALHSGVSTTAQLTSPQPMPEVRPTWYKDLTREGQEQFTVLANHIKSLLAIPQRDLIDRYVVHNDGYLWPTFSTGMQILRLDKMKNVDGSVPNLTDFFNSRRISLAEADLRKANLRGVNLSNANLYDTDLRHADLRGADLRGASLMGANLMNADLSGADIRGAQFAGANISRANLVNAKLDNNTIFCNVTADSIQVNRRENGSWLSGNEHIKAWLQKHGVQEVSFAHAELRQSVEGLLKLKVGPPRGRKKLHLSVGRLLDLINNTLA